MKAIHYAVLVLATMAVAKSATAETVRGLEPLPGQPERDGFAIGLVLKGAAAMELGDLQTVSGIGGGPTFRMGTSAGENLVFWLELDGAGYLFRTMTDEVALNQFAVGLLSTQLFVMPAVWIKGGVGAATYRQRVQRQIELDPILEHRGLAAASSGGIDLVRRGNWALGLESGVTGAYLGGSLVVQVWGGLGLHLY